MWFRLALAMGEPDVGRLQTSITSAQFAEWLAFYAVEPFGPAREDYRAGVVAAATNGTLPRKATKTRPILPLDWFPELKPRRKRQTADEMQKMLRGLAARGIGTFTEGGKK